jgi:AmiR/NasT family two-component response regulator
MAPAQTEALRILIANERDERLDTISEIVHKLGHDVIARNIDITQIAAQTRAELPDVALVGLGLDGGHALDLISEIVHEAACPVIALLDAADPAYVTEAAKRGVFAYVVIDEDPQELKSALEITLLRFAESHNLEGAFGRRATIEQAKGILMERNSITADQAFQQLREHSQQTGRKLVDVAQAVTESHRLLHLHSQADESA